MPNLTKIDPKLCPNGRSWEMHAWATLSHEYGGTFSKDAKNDSFTDHGPASSEVLGWRGGWWTMHIREKCCLFLTKLLFGCIFVWLLISHHLYLFLLIHLIVFLKKDQPTTATILRAPMQKNVKTIWSGFQPGWIWPTSGRGGRSQGGLECLGTAPPPERVGPLNNVENMRKNEQMTDKWNSWDSKPRTHRCCRVGLAYLGIQICRNINVRNTDTIYTDAILYW